MELKFLATNLEDFDKIQIYYGYLVVHELANQVLSPPNCQGQT
jgi:hypothetical protein